MNSGNAFASIHCSFRFKLRLLRFPRQSVANATHIHAVFAVSIPENIALRSPVEKGSETHIGGSGAAFCGNVVLIVAALRSGAMYILH